eukprot:TRINITY_DN11578_c0_g1_i1.p1 TRINITY_DN11578_c0_g1~~TRINITY_DN11578_c0_g1_i1.p1  ORF type:complete len:153 (-),score=36.30 TRINITY_DN11578_c0_g1_i1:39-497(-)
MYPNPEFVVLSTKSRNTIDKTRKKAKSFLYANKRRDRNLIELLNKYPNFGVGKKLTRDGWVKKTNDKPMGESYWVVTRASMHKMHPNFNFGKVWGVRKFNDQWMDNKEEKLVNGTTKRVWRVLDAKPNDNFIPFPAVRPPEMEAWEEEEDDD